VQANGVDGRSGGGIGKDRRNKIIGGRRNMYWVLATGASEKI